MLSKKLEISNGMAYGKRTVEAGSDLSFILGGPLSLRSRLGLEDEVKMIRFLLIMGQ
jgi:hypothetical protein